MSDPASTTPPSPAPPPAAKPPAWQPIAARDRRVLGVLVEKAKTTPDVYPLSINALRTGCNQKNNRYPLMELENEDVEQSLDRLRALGAVSEVQGDSRVPRYRHLLYDWLGVDKVELAVMAELLLRGAQTEGDLRGRAARMEPLPDLNVLRGVLTSLKAKKLVVGLTPEGRGHSLTHALYLPQEMEKLRAEHHAVAGAEPLESAAAPTREISRPAAPAPTAPPVTKAPAAAQPTSAVASPAGERAVRELEGTVATLRAEVAALREDFDRLRREVDELLAQLR
ncbi:MAG TPA: DUF480 domain-containing protein [Pirellulales bacterium]|nr:DUF480 domain-containing protein [Pirellulales bacterium]